MSPLRLGACAFFVFAPIGVQMPFFPLWLSAKGFPPDLIALLLGVSPIVRFAANLVAPPHADRTGDPVGVLLACAVAAAAAQALSGLPFGVAWIFALALLAAAGQGPMIPLLDSIVLREARRRVTAGEAPLDYGVVRSAGSVSVLILMLAGGAAAGLARPGAVIWFIAGASAAAALAVALLLPRRTMRSEASAPAPSREKQANLPLVLLVIATSSAVQASHAMVYAFGSIGWRKAGFTDGAIGLLWACGVATEVALFVFAGRLSKGRSLAYPFLIAGSATAAARWGIMASDPAPLVVFIAQTLHAGSFAATYLGAVTAIAALAGEGRRAQMQGWISAANALTLAATTIACGPLWSVYGARGYLFVAALAAAGTLCASLAGWLAARAQPQSAGSAGNTVEPS